MAIRDIVQAAAGVGGGSEYVEDVFSTYLYKGNDSVEPTIVNGIDLENEGGLVWIKSRDDTPDHYVFDTERGLPYLIVNSTAAQQSAPLDYFISYNSDGFTGANKYNINKNNGTFASWTFRKAPKFFDVVTYTGTGSATTIAHSLGSVPGMIIVKRTDGSNPWTVYHRGSSPTVPEDKELKLNTTTGAVNGFTTWNRTLPTDAVFSVGTEGKVNENGWQYVAYIFAHDAGGFGDDGEQNVISCGSYTGNGSTDGPEINLGFEPQWLLIKNSTNGGNWVLMDAMRGMPVGDEAAVLLPNASNPESSYANLWGVDLQATGFKVNVSQIQINESGGTMIYIAIRRPMKVPEAGTEVFALQDPGYPVDSNGLAFTSNFPVDLALLKERTDSADGWYTMSRLQGSGNFMKTNSTAAESSGVSSGTFDHNTGWYKTASASMSWMFKRAPGFMDVVAWTKYQTVDEPNHNLGVIPELIIYKNRSRAGYWVVLLNMASYANSGSEVYLNDSQGTGGTGWGGNPTASKFFLKTMESDTNGDSRIAYLFSTLAGVSKVGSYTGTHNTTGPQTIDCGFAAGARFVLIKRTDAVSSWWVFDTARGITSGNDPYLELNSSGAEDPNLNMIDPASSGFIAWREAVNIQGASYIFLAIA